jgi:hypothetical protein
MHYHSPVLFGLYAYCAPQITYLSIESCCNNESNSLLYFGSCPSSPLNKAASVITADMMPVDRRTARKHFSSLPRSLTHALTPPCYDDDGLAVSDFHLVKVPKIVACLMDDERKESVYYLVRRSEKKEASKEGKKEGSKEGRKGRANEQASDVRSTDRLAQASESAE